MENVILLGTDTDEVDARMERGNIQWTIGGHVLHIEDAPAHQVRNKHFPGFASGGLYMDHPLGGVGP